MRRLNELKWKEFVLGDIFTITSTSSSIDKGKLISKSGIIPYVTRTDKNNGYDCFVSKQDDKYGLDCGNVITVGLDTQTVFYQPQPFYTGQNIQIFTNKNINKYSAMFIISLLKRQLAKFGWGSNGATLTRLKRSKILLPINEAEHLDYKFMEEYMREIEKQQIQKYLQYLRDVQKPYKNIMPLDQKEWQEFFIGELFNLQPGKSKGLNHLNETENGYSYLGATNQNNGVLCLVEPVDELVQKGNCIVFIRNGEGSMGYSVYKAENFIATSDMSIGYNPYLNRY
ncbi:MAG: restriction endonuclease subunit S, partial [Ruminiclostridium sp.]